MRRRRGQRGAAAVEWALLAPVLVMVVCAMVAGWRLQSTRAGLTHAAEAGARAASLERDMNTADLRARESVRANAGSLPCDSLGAEPDVSGFRVPVGNPAAVSVRVTCRVRLADLLVPGLPGQIDVEAQAATPLDRYRRR